MSNVARRMAVVFWLVACGSRSAPAMTPQPPFLIDPSIASSTPTATATPAAAAAATTAATPTATATPSLPPPKPTTLPLSSGTHDPGDADLAAGDAAFEHGDLTT